MAEKVRRFLLSRTNIFSKKSLMSTGSSFKRSFFVNELLILKEGVHLLLISAFMS